MDHRKSLLFAHCAVFLLGFTALMTDLSALSAEKIVLGRTAFAAPVLFLLIRHRAFYNRVCSASLKYKFLLPFTSVLLCAHWLCFFESIDQGSVAIALLTLACTPFFIIVLNCIAGIQKSFLKDFITCFIILLGIFVMVPKTFESNSMAWILGLASAMLVAGFSFTNKLLISKFESIELSMIQTGLCVPILLMFVPYEAIIGLTSEQWLYLAACGIVCTALAQTLLLQSMKHLSALSASFIVNLEPVYGILLAVLILGDQIPMNQWLGGSIVFLGVIFSSLPLRIRGQVVLS